MQYFIEHSPFEILERNCNKVTIKLISLLIVWDIFMILPMRDILIFRDHIFGTKSAVHFLTFWSAIVRRNT